MTRFSKKPNSVTVAARGIAGAAPNVGRQLGAVARRVREGQGLTLTDVATTAGISAGMLSRLETGHVTPSLETLVALSAALGVRPALLLQDVAYAEHAVGHLVTVPLSQGQHDALVSFTYNEGAGRLQTSTLAEGAERRGLCGGTGGVHEVGVWRR